MKGERRTGELGEMELPHDRATAVSFNLCAVMAGVFGGNGEGSVWSRFGFWRRLQVPIGQLPRTKKDVPKVYATQSSKATNFA